MTDLPRDPRGRELTLLLERAKYERWLGREVEQLLEAEFNELVDLVQSRRFRTLTQFQQQRKVQLFREIEQRLTAGYGGVKALHLDQMRGYAQLEAEVGRVQVASVLSAEAAGLRTILDVSLPKTYLASIARLPIQGLSIGDWFETQAQTMSRESRRIIQLGLVEGKGTAAISRQLLADARAVTPTLAQRAKREALIISRTTVNAVQNDAALASFHSLPASVSDSYRLLVVKDARTSVICAALSDRVFRFDDPKRKVPPFHMHCRTGVQPIVKGAEITMADQQSRPMSMRSYSEWLATQPIGVQNEVLGVARAGLWRDGKMQLADAIDADNRVLTLPQLRAKLGL